MIKRSWVQSQAGAVEEFSSPQLTFSLQNQLPVLLLSVHSTPVLLQWHTKDASHFAKSADGSLHLNTHTRLTHQSPSELTVLSRYGVRPLSGKQVHTQLIREWSYVVSSPNHCRLILA